VQTEKYSGKQAVVTRLVSFGLGLLCLAFAIPLAAYTYMGSFIRIIGDDYCYAARLRQFGFWMTQWQSYVSIVGYNGNRYSLNLFSSLVGLFGPQANAVLPGLAGRPGLGLEKWNQVGWPSYTAPIMAAGGRGTGFLHPLTGS
jgi:hypothetical protein